MERNLLLRRNDLTWLLVTLAAQTGWGAYPVLARYLQTVSDLPSMSILALGSLIALCTFTAIYLPRLVLQDFKSGRLIVFALIVMGRGVTNFFAARFTLAIYVLLITLLTPFIVALLSTLVWREKLPQYTGRALILGITGTMLIVGADLTGAQTMPTANRTDWLGISLAVVSSLLLAIYMIVVRRSTLHSIRAEPLLIVQLMSLALAGFSLSFLLDESWQQWRAAGFVDWAVFGLLTFGVLVGSNLGQIGALRNLGAAIVSSAMPWRLVSVLFVSAILLDERLKSVWQLLGVFLVMGTVSWYLWQQRR